MNSGLAIFGSFLLGFGDACYNTQIYALIGSVYKDNSAPAFAIFKFVQSGLAAAAFFYSKYLELQYQLLLLGIFCIFGTLSFIIMDVRNNGRTRGQQFEPVNDIAEEGHEHVS